MKSERPPILLLGPSRAAMSGVTTHVNLLLGSPLAADFALVHFQVGSEGRDGEGALGRLARLALSPFALAAAVLRLDAGVVHINSSLNLAFWRDLAYLAAAKLCGARVLFQVHGGALPLDFMKGSLGRAFLRAALSLPDAVVVLATSELDAYREFLPSQNVLALPNGIDCVPYARYDREPAGAGGGPLRLVYVGRLAAEKGLHEALEALGTVRAAGVAATLFVAGSGPEEAPLRQRVAALGLGDAVRFVGAVSGDAKARLLSQADVILLPSYAEGLPYALLEGMAAGAVPVATRVGAIPDVMTQDVHGVFVPLRDARAIAGAIQRLASDRRALARMSSACRRRVAAAYSIGRLAGELSALYAVLCGPRSPRAVL